MKPLVVDASARLDTLRRPALAGRLFAEHDVCAPTLLRWEVGNVIHGRKRETFGVIKTRRAIVAALLKHVRLEDQAGREDAITDLVETHRLSFYDAAYLQLALDEEAPLVTEDAILRRAAQKSLGAGRAWDLDAAEDALR